MQVKYLTTVSVVLMLTTCLTACAEETQKETRKETQISVQKDTEHDSKSTKASFAADLNHDGKQETLMIQAKSVNEVDMTVTENDEVLYENKAYINASLGEQYYLVSQDGNDYIMEYGPLVDHDAVAISYEVFSLDENGNKQTLDSDEIEVSLFDVSQMDKDCWKSFAEKENVYFSNAVLLFSGTDGKLVMGNEEETIRYKENFAWMVSSSEKGDSADKNLDLFIQETKRDYPQNSDK